MRELAERSLLQGQTGAYVSTADVSEAKVPAILEATIAARIDPLNMLDVETVARWPDHPDHRAVATECALQRALNGGNLPAPPDQHR